MALTMASRARNYVTKERSGKSLTVRMAISPAVWLTTAVVTVLVFNLWGTIRLDDASTETSTRRLEDVLGNFSGLLSSWTSNPTDIHTATTIEEAPSIPPSSVNLEDMARSMLQSFAPMSDGLPNKTAYVSRRDFPRLIVASENPSAHASTSQCVCDLLTLDCLHSIACIPTSQEHRNAQVLLGMETRKAIIQTSTFDGEVHDAEFIPIGKGHQYSTIDAFMSWRWDGRLPRKYATFKHLFVDETRYEYCREKKLHGKSCFFRKMSLPEDSKREALERQAQEWKDNHGGDAATVQIQKVLQSFVLSQRRQFLEVFLTREEIHGKTKRSHGGVPVPTSTMSPLGQLMLFSHISRLLFSRRPFLQEIYEDKLTTVKHKRTDAPQDPSKDESPTLPPFTVSVHMRRGDACGRNTDIVEFPYMKEPSDLHSPAQMTSVRKCYETHVYLEPLERIRQILPKNQPLHVYLSTDDVGSIMDDIATNYSHIFKNVVDEWKIMDYARSNFRYDFSDTIESDKNDKQAIMGETAVNDLWLLSHGQAFVGHLGSRFGKVAWMLATSRHNAFIPYFSVDGHSKSWQKRVNVVFH